MKKIFFFLFLGVLFSPILFTSCKKDEIIAPVEKPAISINNTTYHTGDVYNVDGVAYIYNGDNTWTNTVNNQTYVWSPTYNSFVVTYNIGDVITLSGNAVLVNGTLVNNNQVFYNNQVYNHHVTNVQNTYNYWTTYNSVTNTTTYYTFNTTTQNFVTINVVHNYASCCPDTTNCQTDTLYIQLPGDSSIIIQPVGAKAVPGYPSEYSWYAAKAGNGKSGLWTLSGGTGEYRVAIIWGPSTHGTSEFLGVFGGKYRFKSQSLIAGQEVVFELDSLSAGNIPLTAGISDGNMGFGPLYLQKFEMTVQGQTPSAWSWHNWAEFWYKDTKPFHGLTVPYTKNVEVTYDQMGTTFPGVSGYTLMWEVDPVTGATNYIVDPITGEKIAVADYVYPPNQ